MNPNIPTVKELWKKEKSKYRHWVIILAIGLLIISTLTWTSFILNLIDKDNIIDKIKDSLEKEIKATPYQIKKMANERFIRNNIIIASLISLSTLAGVIWYFISLVKVYKHKNFANLSKWPTLIIGVGTFISFIQLIMFAFSPEENASIFATKASILSFATRIIYILIYFAASSPITKVRRTFLISQQWEKLQKDEKFQKMQSQLGGALKGGSMPYGGFGPVLNPNETNNNFPTSSTSNDGNNSSINVEKEKRLQRLKGLSIEKLKKVGKKLSISGYKLMDKDELIKAILRVSGY